MTSSIICRNRFVGKEVEIPVEFSRRKSFNVSKPSDVSMLVYIDLASAEYSVAFSGSVNSLRSWIMSVEFFVYY